MTNPALPGDQRRGDSSLSPSIDAQRLERLRHTRGRRRTLAAIVGAAAVAAIVGTSLASDHQDTPDVELSPRMDVNDVYAFPGSSADRIVLVMTTSSPITPAQSASAVFDANLLYQFKIDNTGDGVEDRVIQMTAKGSGASQQITIRGPVAPAEVGTRNTIVEGAPTLSGTINQPFGSATAIQAFAGLRDDPFFLDLEQFFRIVPDRKPVSGALSQLPEQPSASAFRPAGQAVDYLRGLNTLAFVIELPVSAVTAGGNARIGVWGTISR